LVGVSVEHQEPLRARLLRGTRRLPLSPTQREVCVLLAAGASQGDLARHLRIKPSTVKDHVSKVYEKLGVNCREDLAALLHRWAGPAAGDTDGA
jgi:DNA-binding CsgD family transcriptional regulator